jgi:hypothetical protein
MTPAERRLRAQLGAHTMHARNDPKKTTAKARAAFLASFEAKADPTGDLPVEERRRRAESLRKAHFARLALASATARRSKRVGQKGGEEAADRRRSEGGRGV